MKKFIGLVLLIVIIIGFTGINIKMKDGKDIKVPPYIKNVLNDKKKMNEAKKVFNEATEAITKTVE